jgi:hypothetical protein
MDIDFFVYTGRQGGNDVPQDVVRVRVDPSVTSTLRVHLANARSWPRWNCVKASRKLGIMPLRIAAI